MKIHIMDEKLKLYDKWKVDDISSWMKYYKMNEKLRMKDEKMKNEITHSSNVQLWKFYLLKTSMDVFPIKV
jgi:hypothetical protein